MMVHVDRGQIHATSWNVDLRPLVEGHHEE
jgi:hypothetical protein